MAALPALSEVGCAFGLCWFSKNPSGSPPLNLLHRNTSHALEGCTELESYSGLSYVLPSLVVPEKPGSFGTGVGSVRHLLRCLGDLRPMLPFVGHLTAPASLGACSYAGSMGFPLHLGV